MDRPLSFLTCGEAGKCVLNFQANFSEVFEMSSLNDGSSDIQIRLQVSNFFYEHNTLMHKDQPLRDKPLKMAFGSTEKP